MSAKTLSIFIDESGDFGTYEPHAPYYLVALVYHDQSNDISQNLSSFETHLDYHGYGKHALHTGPLIRREADYANESPEVRKRLFSALFNFARKMPLYYDCIQIEKQNCADEIALTARISRKFGEILDRSKSFFDSFDNIIIYVDAIGQQIFFGVLDCYGHLMITGCGVIIPEVFFRCVITDLPGIFQQLRQLRILFLQLLEDIHRPFQAEDNYHRQQDMDNFL